MKKLIIILMFSSCSFNQKQINKQSENITQTVTPTVHTQSVYPKVVEETKITASDNVYNFSHKIITQDIVPSIVVVSSSNTVSKTAEVVTPVVQPPLTLWQKIKRQFTFWSLVFCGVTFFFPTVGLVIFKFLYNRTKNCLTTVVSGIEDFKSDDKELLTNTLSRKMDRKDKQLIKKLKVRL